MTRPIELSGRHAHATSPLAANHQPIPRDEHTGHHQHHGPVAA